MWRIRTGSRLHPGLLSLPSPNSKLRRFGGAGLMVEDPAIVLLAEESSAWDFHGPASARVEEFVALLRKDFPLAPPTRFIVQEIPEAHSGLGSGTQLALAVAKLFLHRCEVTDWSEAIALRLGRGLRSAIGVYGFARGGFIVEGGKRENASLSPLLVQKDFPEDWSIVLLRAEGEANWHGRRERQAMSEIEMPEAVTDRLARLVLLEMLPAIQERDCRGFGEALTELNRKVGEVFAAVQGGIYASAQVAECVERLKQAGAVGVAQSSWGPTVFAVVEDEQKGAYLATKLGGKRTKARNVGCVVQERGP
jgi:beta-RFAP synthase